MNTTIHRFIITLFFFTTIFASICYSQPKRWRRPHPKVRQAKIHQQPAMVGLRIGNDFRNEQILLGGQFWLPVGIFWKFAPGFEYYFTDKSENFSRWQYNADFLFKPRPRGFFYIGGGLAVQHILPDNQDADMNYGGNAIIGIDFSRRRMSTITPYIQSRWTFFPDEDYFTLIGGINLILK